MTTTYINYGGDLSCAGSLQLNHCTEVFLHNNNLSHDTSFILSKNLKTLFIGQNSNFGEHGGFSKLKLPPSISKLVLYGNKINFSEFKKITFPHSLQHLFLQEQHILSDPSNDLHITDLYTNVEKIAHTLQIHKKCPNLKYVELFTSPYCKPWCHLNNYVLKLCRKERHNICRQEYLYQLYLFGKAHFNSKMSPKTEQSLFVFLSSSLHGTKIAHTVLSFFNPELN